MSSSTPHRLVRPEAWERPFVRTHKAWCGDFVLALRLRNVPGPVIGDRLAEVEGHCADTGQTPSEAFGDPTDYAARLDHDGSPERTSGLWPVTAAASSQVLALFVGSSAATAWARGEPLTYNLGQVLCLGLVVLVLLAVPLLLGPMVRHPWTITGPLAAVVLLGAGGAALSGRADLPTVAQPPAPGVAVGLFAVVLVLAWVQYRELTRDADGDLVTSPLAATTGQPTATSGDRWRRAALVPTCLVPAAYIAFAAMAWLLA